MHGWCIQSDSIILMIDGDDNDDVEDDDKDDVKALVDEQQRNIEGGK